VLGSLPQALASGMLYSAAGQGRMPHIARDDLARAAAAVLASGKGGKATYTLSGATAYSVDELAALASNVTGKPLKVVAVPPEGLVQGMLAAGLPKPIAEMVASFDVAQAQGGFDVMPGDYKALTGRDPQTLESWLQANKAALGA
jgi:NAD(P)H dehydrogenase (quinone)